MSLKHHPSSRVEQRDAAECFAPSAPVTRRLPIAVLLLALGAGALCHAESEPAGPIRGFIPSSAAREAEFEQIFRSVPTPDQARRDLEVLTREPHVAGTPADYRTAQYVLRQFRDAGLDAEIVEYQVLMPMPKEVTVELVRPVRYEASSNEGPP